MKNQRTYFALLLVVCFGACSHSDSKGKVNAPRAAAPPPAAAPSASAVASSPSTGSLYDRLGKLPAITAVVGEFVGRLAADPRVKFRFANSNVPKLTSDLVDFVCLASGGPCTYQGREMQVLHASMQVTEEEWNAVVEALVGALEKFQVGEKEKAELLGAVGSTKAQIVDPPKQAPPADLLARIDAASADLAGFGEQKEILQAALTALRHGQRSYAEQLFSIAEVKAEPTAIAKLAPLFRDGGPPRITSKLTQMPLDAPPQPKGVVGGSEADGVIPTKDERGSLSGTLQIVVKNNSPAFGVVMLTPVKGKPKIRVPKERIVEQRGREFAPRVMAVPVGSTVAFPNFDDIYHNVFSRSDAKPFDLGIFKNGQARQLTFDKPGIVKIGCNLHANMAATIIVVDAAHYAVTDEKGSFTFRTLKPGAYSLQAWSERSAEPVTQTIEIKNGPNTITLDANGVESIGPSPDKFGTARGPGA